MMRAVISLLRQGYAPHKVFIGAAASRYYAGYHVIVSITGERRLRAPPCHYITPEYIRHYAILRDTR